MTDVATTATDTSPLTLDEGIKALTSAETEEETGDGSPETDDAPEGETDDELQASDEASEDADGDIDPEEDPDASDDAEPEARQGRFVADDAKVRLADGTVTSIHELKRGFLREADYTRKTQDISAREKSTETAASALKQRETELTERLSYAEQLIQAIEGQEPDPSLLQTDPMAYMAQKANWEAWQKHRSFISQEKLQSAEKAKAEAETKAKERAQTEWDALVGAMPELKDETRLKAFADDLRSHGAAYKLTEQEIASIPHDHRFALILRDAVAMRKLRERNKAKTPAPKTEARPPVLRGGTRQNPATFKAREANAAMDRLNRTGSLRDGVAAFIALEKQKR